MFSWPGGHWTYRGTLLPGDPTMIPSNWKLRLPPGHFGLLISSKSAAKKEDTVLPGVMDPDYQREIGHNDGG